MNYNNVKSNLSHLASDTFDRGQDFFQDTTKSFGKAIASAASAKAISKFLNPDAPVNYVLGAMGLQRRPSTFSRIATGAGLIAFGAAVGAGVAFFLSPNTGAQNRDMVRRRVNTFRRDAEEVVDELGTRAHDAAAKVETRAQELAGSAHDLIGDGANTKADNHHRASGGSGSTGKHRNPGLSHRSPKA